LQFVYLQEIVNIKNDMDIIIEIELGEVIANRELNYKSTNGEQSLIVKLGKPRLDSKPGGDWECPIQIGEKIKLGYGVDSYQALLMAIQLVSIDLKYLKDKQKLNLNWLGMDDLGLNPISE